MTATGHSMMGLALASLIPNPLIGIPIAFISHIACDAFPHWDTGTNMKVNNPTTKKTRFRFVIESFFDLGLSFVLPFILLATVFQNVSPLYAFIMILSAQGFDWLSAPRVFLRWDIGFFNWICTLQGKFDHRLDKPWGIITQVAVLLFFLGLAKFA